MNKGTLARKVGLAAIATLTAFAGLAPFAPGASAAANYTQVRLFGEDRFETAAAIAAEIDDATPTAVIARADIFPDALTGAYAAASNDDAPILLTRSDDVPQTTLDALEDLGVEDVILLGGPDAIDGGVESDLEGEGYNVDRIFGETRYQTAIEIAEAGDFVGTNSDGETVALVASGEVHADALSGAPLSFASFFPSLLVPKTTENADPGVETALNGFVDDVTDALDGLGIERVYILGGPAAVDEGVEEMITNAGFDVARLAGANRGDTSVRIFQFGMDEGTYTNTRFGIARGDTFPDALAYAPLGGRPRGTIPPDSGAPDTGGATNGLLLANGTCDLHDEVEEFLAANSDTWTYGEILGGNEAFCPELANEVEDLATAGLAGITLDDTSVAPGDAITGTITGENIRSVEVSGCGLDEEVNPDANGNFTLTLPLTETEDCELVFFTTFDDGSTEFDTFQIDVEAPGEPDVTLTPSSGTSGSSTTATFSGDRPGNITSVSSPNCTIGTLSPGGTSSPSQTFTVTGTPGTVCTINTTGTFNDDGTTWNETDTFTLSGGTTPPPPSGTAGVSSGPQLATEAPDLTSCSIFNGDPADATPNAVDFTFDEPVAIGPSGTGTGTGYSLQGFDSNRELQGTAGSAAIVGSGNTVRVGFDNTQDLRQFTICVADSDVVNDGSNQNALAAKALGGSNITGVAGRTAAPDLVSVTNRNAGTREITYNFDQPVGALIFATEFGFYDSNGNQFLGNNVTAVSTDRTSVTIQYAPGTSVTSAVRDFVADESEANGDSAVQSNQVPVRDNPINHLGGTTTATPDLISVARVANVPNQIDFNFDEPVTVTDCTDFALYRDDASRLNGITCTQPSGLSSVRVDFGNTNVTENNANQFVLAGVEGTGTFVDPNSAVTGTTGSARPNTFGAFPLETTGAQAGFTDGPDLINATYDSNANSVTFTFDERVNDALAFINESSFFLINAAGDAYATGGPGGTPTPSVNTTTNQVTIFFAPGTVVLARGSGVVSESGIQSNVPDSGIAHAVEDFQTNRNSPDSVGR